MAESVPSEHILLNEYNQASTQTCVWVGVWSKARVQGVLTPIMPTVVRLIKRLMVSVGHRKAPLAPPCVGLTRSSRVGEPQARLLSPDCGQGWTEKTCSWSGTLISYPVFIAEARPERNQLAQALGGEWRMGGDGCVPWHG